MTHTTKTPAQLRAEIAEREAANERDRAALAAMEAEPDALEAAVIAACDAAYREVYDEKVPKLNTPYVKAFVRNFALPLAPAEPVDEAWIERTARECADKAANEHTQWAGCLAGARLAIRATLNRGARWPGVAVKVSTGQNVECAPEPVPDRGKDYCKPEWMGDRCTTETTCAAFGRCMPVFGRDCGAKV
jgi:hypothetical protein